MKFSIMLPRPTGAPSPTELDDIIELARTVERLGLHAVSASDHPFPRIRDGQAGHQSFDPFVLLTSVGASTERIGLHFSLLVSGYRNPFLAARMLSTLDLLCPGRVLTAIGAGYLVEEFHALGATFEGRGRILRESVEAMKTAWTGREVHASGHGWRADGNVMSPVPATAPRPRLWRGGNGDRAIRHAAEAFDGWAPFEVNDIGSQQTDTQSMSLATLPAKLAFLRECRDAQNASGPFDICYVRTSRQWLKSPQMIADDLHNLDSQGVNWLEFNILGRTLTERAEFLEQFAEQAAGLSDPARSA